MPDPAPIVTIEDAPKTTPTAVAGNSPEARNPDGSLKENAAVQTTQTPTDTTAKADPKVAQTPDGEISLLNEKGEPAVLTGAPEKYGDFTAPDGYEFKAETMDGARTLFKELNLSQAGAQRLVDFHTAELKAVLEAPAKAWEETRAKWLEEVRADPEIGGRLDQVKATVARAIDGLGDSKLATDFRQAMNFTGAGNNPAFIRAFFKLAQKVTEGTIVPGGGPSEVKAPNAPPATAARRLYPNLP